MFSTTLIFATLLGTSSTGSSASFLPLVTPDTLTYARPAVLCAEALASLARQPLIQPNDVRARIDDWDLTPLERASLKWDLGNPRVRTSVAYLKGERLTNFVATIDEQTKKLNESVWSERRRRAAGFDRRRPWARTLAFAMAAGAIGVGQHWGAQAAAQILFAASLLEAKVAYHRHRYLATEATLTDVWNGFRLTRVRGSVQLLDRGLDAPPVSAQFDAWLGSRLIDALTSPRPPDQDRITAAVNESMEFTARWGWLHPLIPGRRRVIFNYHVDVDSTGAPALTIVSRVKRW